MATEEQMKNVVLKAEEFLSAFEHLTGYLNEKDKDNLRQLAGGPVGLRNINKFNAAIDLPTRIDVQAARRNLAGAIAAEKWLDGFVFAVQLMAMLGG